jgi:hypothetical protein
MPTTGVVIMVKVVSKPETPRCKVLLEEVRFS